MNKRERELLGRVYDSVGTLASLRPPNPADIKAISHNLKISTEGAGRLHRAISSLGFGDHRDCAECLDEAEAVLAQRSGAMTSDRLRELAEIGEERELTPAELVEAFDLSRELAAVSGEPENTREEK